MSDSEPNNQELHGSEATGPPLFQDRPASESIHSLNPRGDMTDTREATWLLESIRRSVKDSSQPGSPRENQGEDLLKNRTGEYSLRSVLGRGGQGEVWEALQVSLGRVVAVKRARGNPEKHLEFYREAITTAQLDHPNIIPIHDLGTLDHAGNRSPVLIMRKVQGKSWKETLAADRQLHVSREGFLLKHLPILLQVTNAVAYAHSRGIIHRDLKPAQVMLGDYGEVYLVDWGLAVFVGSETAELPRSEVTPDQMHCLATASNPAGTPVYMAPEQTSEDPRVLGFHTDIYLLGAILHELVSGRPPREGAVFGVMVQASRNEYLPLPGDVPPELAALVTRCMATDPRDRPSSARAFHDELEAFLTGAGRRDESVRITRELLTTGFEGGYTELSDKARRLGQATQLWPGNPDAARLHVALLEAFVDAALARKDFILAQVQASRVRDEETAKRLLARIDSAGAKAEAAEPVPPIYTPWRVAAMVSAVALVLFAVFQVVAAARDLMAGEVTSKVETLAALAAREVRGADLRAVGDDPTISSPEFQTVLFRLNAIRRANNDICNIYTLAPSLPGRGGHWAVLVDGDPLSLDVDGNGTTDIGEQGRPPGSLFDGKSDAMSRALATRKPASGVLMTGRGEYFAGFAPVMDPVTRRPVALLGVNFLMDSLRARFRTVAAAGVGASILLAGLVLVAFRSSYNSRHALDRVRALHAKLRKQNAELRNTEIHLG